MPENESPPDDEPKITHVFEAAPSGRAKCRGCGVAIAKGDIRFGERLPNPYGDGLMTLWFHPRCGSYKRPEPFLEALETTDVDVELRDELAERARFGLAHRRLPRLHGAERSPTGRARCRSCREMIAKESWRFSLVYYDDGRFDPSGFIHAQCSQEYFETVDVMDRARHFAELSDGDAEELTAELTPSESKEEPSSE